MGEPVVKGSVAAFSAATLLLVAVINAIMGAGRFIFGIITLPIGQ